MFPLIQCWGKNSQGNLGLGDVHDRGDDEGELEDDIPLVPLGSPMLRIDAGDDHTYALLNDRNVKVGQQLQTERSVVVARASH